MPHVTKRKIIRYGRTSYGVVLPKPWLRYFGIKQGDEVEMVSNHFVIIKPLVGKEQTENMEEKKEEEEKLRE
ncbi:MAG: AbrB/MazE/SpoVT family DNA-binding domain-containing protein [Candidatus Nezhaarchaeales archaeon]